MNRAVRKILRGVQGTPAFDAGRYWEERYARGGNSGDGSYGSLAGFKASIMNDFIHEKGIRSAIEFGCGDGHQLSLIEYPAYIGLDVSRSAIQRCIEQSGADPARSFFLYDPGAFADRAGLFRSDVALSLDVIYHIVSDSVFDKYMTDLCDAGGRFVVVYSTDSDFVETVHVRHRRFTAWMETRRPEFRLVRRVDNPFAGDGPQQSNAAFFFFERTS